MYLDDGIGIDSDEQLYQNLVNEVKIDLIKSGFVPKELKLKNIQKVIDKVIIPKCQLKWDISYEKIFNWISIGIYCFHLILNSLQNVLVVIFLFLRNLISSSFHHPVYYI
jgi:hypothetical protein